MKMVVETADKKMTMVVRIVGGMKTTSAGSTAVTRTIVVESTTDTKKAIVVETTVGTTLTIVVEITKARLDIRKRRKPGTSRTLTGMMRTMATAVKRGPTMTHITLHHARKKPLTRTIPARKRGRTTTTTAAAVVAVATAAVAVKTAVTTKIRRAARRTDPIREEAGEQSIQHTVLLTLQTDIVAV